MIGAVVRKQASKLMPAIAAAGMIVAPAAAIAPLSPKTAKIVKLPSDLIEVLNGKPMALARSSIDDLLTPIAYRDGINAMVAAYHRLDERSSEYDLSERAFNTLGYKFLRRDKLNEAIQVLQWATERYPRSANTFDSLGEAYRAAGRKAEAVESYRQALKLDPQSNSARDALSALEAGT